MEKSYLNGLKAEDIAASYLQNKGWTILDRRWRCRTGEIDLVARDGSFLVFIEVKYRSSLDKGLPAEAVDPEKIRKILSAARLYMAVHHISEVPVRFDVIALWKEKGRGKVHHYHNAFGGT